MRFKAILKWFFIGLGAILGVALLGVLIVYILIGIDRGRTFEDVEGTSVHIPNDEASITEGARLARLRGCNGGCHGETINGAIFFDVPDGTRVVAPNLSLTARNYSTAELERMIRHGIRPDDTSVLVAMPSTMFYNLSDSDLGKIIAFLKSQDANDEQLPGTKVGPLARLFFFYYKQMLGSIMAAELIDHSAKRIDPATYEGAASGHYLSMTICTECHGDNLRGSPDGWTPTLALVAGYSIEDFRKLMREGIPTGDRELDVMAKVALSRFTNLSDAEIDNLHAYLQTLASTAPES
jgi:cytochrome c553